MTNARRLSVAPDLMVVAPAKAKRATRQSHAKDKPGSVFEMPKPARKATSRAAQSVAATAGRPAKAAPTERSRPTKSVRRQALPQLADDQLIGQAALEVARLRAEMQHIRYLMDSQPLAHLDAHTMLQRLCQNPMPRSRLAGSTASVIELVPHLRRDGPSRSDEHGKRAVPIPQPGPAIEAMPDAHMATMPAPTLHPVVAPSRIACLLSAWGDWLMWRLMPPEIPAPNGVVRAVVADAIMPEIAETAKPRATHHLDPSEQPAVPVAEIADQAVSRLMDGATMRTHLQEMIREELQGEMGTRFSGNLHAVLRREIASALDDRLTHL